MKTYEIIRQYTLNGSIETKNQPIEVTEIEGELRYFYNYKIGNDVFSFGVPIVLSEEVRNVWVGMQGRKLKKMPVEEARLIIKSRSFYSISA